MKRYPLEPLLDAMNGSHNQACELLGLSGSTQQDYRRRGVTERVGDRLAAKAGLLAYEVWPEMIDDAIAEVERECARHDCTTRFVPVRKRMRFCSTRCQQTEANRRRRKRPEVARQAREYAAQYRADNPEYVDRSAAAYRERNREQINARERERYQARVARLREQEAAA